MLVNRKEMFGPIACVIKVADYKEALGTERYLKKPAITVLTLSIEDDLSMVQILHELRVRIMQLSYNDQSLLATGCYEDRDSGITRFGREVIIEMNRVGMVVDMSHSAEHSTLEAIDISSRPSAITHANPSDFHAAMRNKSGEVLREFGRSGGILRVSLYPFHLKIRV